MWAQDWSNIFDIVAPYPDAPPLDVEKELLNKGYTEIGLFQVSYSVSNFYISSVIDYLLMKRKRRDFLNQLDSMK